jgi:hypothetical protein
MIYRCSISKEVSSLDKVLRTNYVEVEIRAFRTLRLHNPFGFERPFVRGKVVLTGYVQKIDGSSWVRFPTQRHFGLPIKRHPTCHDHIEIVIEEAEFFNDIAFRRTKAKGEDSTS